MVAGLTATVAVLLLLTHLSNLDRAIASIVVAWCAGIVCLLRKRQEEPAWDRTPPPGR